MLETAFIRQNEEKWRAFERVLDGETANPETLNDLFLQVTDDLSYARTFYPNRSVRIYLNGLAQRAFFNIYKNKQSKRSRFIAFWTDGLPAILYQTRRELLLSFLVFFLAVAIGALSCHADPDFLRVILGDSYVEKTEEFIRSGDPMAVYKGPGKFNTFLGITLHNLMVAFQTFLLGVFYAIGTVGSLLYNGVMLGAFQFFFIGKGLFQESFLTVWMHGAFEISSIVLAGAAGLTMGKGLVFPGTLSRLRSFRMAARRGMSIMLGIVPLFVIAGFIESYLTRYTEIPDVLRALFILCCLAAVVFYFVIYPAKKAKRSSGIEAEERHLTPDVVRAVDYKSDKTTGELFTDAFIFYRKQVKPIAWCAVGGACVYCAGIAWGSTKDLAEVFSPSAGLFGVFNDLPRYFANDHNAWQFPLITGVFGVMAFAVQSLLVKEAFAGEERREHRRYPWWDFLKTLVVVALMSWIVIAPQWWTLLLMLFSFPFLFLWNQVMLTEQTGLVKGLGRAFFLSGGSFGQMVGLFFALLLCSALFYLILGSGLLWFLLNVVSMNFFLPAGAGATIMALLVTFMSLFVLLSIFGLWAAGCGLQYFSNLEICEARFMKARIALIGEHKRIRGIEREG